MNYDTSEDPESVIIPITEWPVTEIISKTNDISDITRSKFGDNVFDDGDSDSCVFKQSIPRHESGAKCRFQPYNSKKRIYKPEGGISKPKDNTNTSEPAHNDSLEKQSKIFRCKSKSDYLSGPSTEEDCVSMEQHASVDVKIARWWRKYNATKPPDCLPNVGNASTTLYHITRLPECKTFLLEEKKRLIRDSKFIKHKAEIFAALAGVEDRLENFITGLDHIESALKLQPYNPDYLWLEEKLKRQCQVEEVQEQARSSMSGYGEKFAPFTQVQRMSASDLNVEEFQEKFVKRGKPVILTEVVRGMSKNNFDLSFVKLKAGDKSVRVKKFVQNSVEWARLEDGNMKTIRQFIEEVESGTTSEYLFDWSLPLHCPELADELSVPEFFKDNLLLSTSPGSLYRESWPSLFIAPQGAVSNLHIDAFASHFWMALFQGEKRWTFFDPKDTSFLYPKYFHSMDPVFEVDMGQPDLVKYPLLGLTKPQQCILKPGELLFVPSGSPHYVENLSTSLAVSSNYVNQSNFDETCQQLKVNALLDPRARDLLGQFQQPGFITVNHKLKQSKEEDLHS